MSVDMSRYLGLFVSESTEHLDKLGHDLVELEKLPADKLPAVIDSMFRHAHSVKGMAASMGFEPIATLAHRMEDLIDPSRADPSLLTRDLVDLLLAATDTLMSQVRAAGEGKSPEAVPQLVTQLDERVKELTGKAPAPTRVANAVVSQVTPPSAPVAEPAPIVVETPAQPAPVNAAPTTLGLPPRFALKLKVAASCQVPGVRAFLVYKKLSALGNVFDLKPALEELKAGRIPGGNFALELETSAGETAISQALKSISEIEIVGVSTVAPVIAPPPAPAPAPVAAPVEQPKIVGGGNDQARTVRVRTELLDYFLDTVGELLIATARIREVGKALPDGVRPLLDEGVDRLHGLVKDLHDKVMTVRMTPIQMITDRLPRVARDIARKRGRDVDLVITGAEIELDRAILDELADPLLHLLRNCIDHGLESPEDRAAAGKKPMGRVLVTVRRERDRVIVDMEDDGRGMDAEKLKSAAVTRGLITQEAASRMGDREAYLLACLPGVSTARDVSDISGRGVGMDAVKRAVENVGGTLEIESEKGKGTRFTLRLPLTVAVVNLLLVKVGGDTVGLPIGKVLGAVEADPNELSESRGQKLLSHGNSLVPVYGLAELLNLPAPQRIGLRPYVLMEGDQGRVALEVDRLLGQEEVVLKALSRPLDLIPGLSGVTILGSGRPVFILDVPRLLAA